MDRQLGLVLLSRLPKLDLESRRLNPINNTKKKKGGTIIILKIGDHEHVIPLSVVIV